MKKKCFDFFLISFGAYLCAFATNVFLLPSEISPGGVSGIAQILDYIFQIPVFFTSFVLNSLLLFLCFRLFSFGTLMKNLLGIGFLALFLFFTRNVPPVEIEPVLAAVFGGVLTGAGVGMVLHRGSSTGGTDLAALFIHSRISYIPLALWILILDLFVIGAFGFLLGEISPMLYSALTLYIGSRTTDFILTRGDFAKSIFIVTKNPCDLAPLIMEETGRGSTGIYSYSFFGGKDQMALFCVVKARQLPFVLDLIDQTDPSAFTVILDARQVRGKGFP